MSRGLWLDIKDPRRFPDPGLEVIVTAKQFEWNVTYPGADGVIGTADDYRDCATSCTCRSIRPCT
jgi:hypothetical protein